MNNSRLSLLAKKGLLDDKIQPIPVSHTDNIPLKGWRLDNNLYIKTITKNYPNMDKFLNDGFNINLEFMEGTINATDLIFYDIETTGLSTGGGSQIMLATIGWIDNKKNFIIEQLFIENLSYEKKLISYLNKKIENKILVTYNGKSFDYPMLKSRNIFLNRFEKDNSFIAPQIINHIDLYHFTRRFFRSKLSSCKLSTVENELLSIERHGDIPGSEIPDIYFDFLEDKNYDKLEGVFYHNEMDVFSLLTLLDYLQDVFTNKKYSLLDKYSSSKYFFKKYRNTIIESIIRYKDTSDEENISYKEYEILSMSLKKQKKYEEAAEIWEEMITQQETFDEYPFISLAKYYEHKIKDFDRAIYFSEIALKHLELLNNRGVFIDINKYNDLKKRIKRLLNKKIKNNENSFLLFK